ncbi:glycosyltransferase family 2 protein [Petrocella sp. FN5]|uniref:glycosyltransferase family 2 protein n=1 Tax=Petrocella sp. FN5 TaxID=3032002 RepID=UPI0023DCD5EC|nr:glycosyltransferase family 2 protein [Petrocella sp. FN5]MDF1617759.1 glycosyltransferase family 2 protein [Petrocella sp. FN5]
MNDRALVSIITVCYNSEKYIESAIKSVLSQNYSNIEYIVIDGGSTDRTLDIVRKYSEHSSIRIKVISEPDEGIYDAMNKGVKLAEGDIIGILNSDDFYINNKVITWVVNTFEATNADMVYGNLVFVDRQDTNRIVRVWDTFKGEFLKGWNPPHPSTFIKKSIYKEFGYYKKEYKISSDYDLFFRMIEIGKVNHHHLNKTLVKMRVGGASTSGWKSNYVGSKEIYMTLKEHNVRFRRWIVLSRLLKKIKQFYQRRSV